MLAATWILPVCMLAMSDVRPSMMVHEEVDLIELNHFYDDLGRHVYDQVIFYEWSSQAREFHVRAWSLLDPKEEAHNQPWKSVHDNRWHVRWYDKDYRVVRRIDSDHMRETWSQVDPERANKKKLDEKLRTALIQPGRGVDTLIRR